MTFPEILDQIRMSEGLTQAQLADRVGCHRYSVIQWESGDVKPCLVSMQHVLGLLEIAPREQKEQLAEEFELREMLQVLINELGVRAR